MFYYPQKKVCLCFKKNTMRISATYGISFNAQRISDANILRYNKENGSYEDSSVSFVELNPNDKNDRNAVNEAVTFWKYDLYGSTIAHAMKRTSDSSEKEPSDKYYVITSQKDNFENLNPDEIEALTHVFVSNKRVVVRHLQVNPDFVYAWDKPECKHVGKSMIDCLKELYSDRAITLIATKTATKFYEKQGFEHTKDPENRLTWNKQAEENVAYKDEYW